jgi:hypothetical protein
VDAAGGQATLVRGGRLSPEVAQRVEQQVRDERRAEVGGAVEEAGRLLREIRRRHEGVCLTIEQHERLEAELGVLQRRMEQIRARDHFGAVETAEIDDALRRCVDALSAFGVAAAGRELRRPSAPRRPGVMGRSGQARGADGRRRKA